MAETNLLPKECIRTDSETAYKHLPPAMHEAIATYINSLRVYKTYRSSIAGLKGRFRKATGLYVTYEVLAGWLLHHRPELIEDPMSDRPIPADECADMKTKLR
jgi:hypothetical protein